MKDIVIIANFCRDFSESDNGRFMYLCKMLSKDNSVEIITSDFRHSTKTHKSPLSIKWPFKITFLHEPGYRKNISLKRFYSHNCWGKEVKKYLHNREKPDVIYCAIPSLTAASEAASFCAKEKIRFIIDIQDLWPEAFKMALNVPIVSDLLFYPIKQIADKIYKTADDICGVSQTYVDRALSVNKKCKEGHVVFLGTNTRSFDENVTSVAPILKKPEDAVWLGYCGALSASYDIPCIISALKLLNDKDHVRPKFIVMGDGARLNEFKNMAETTGVDAVFLGRLSYDQMCAQLSQCDIVVNPITKGSAASIINKHADYAAAGKAVINTQDSKEYRNLVEKYGMGFNCENGNSESVAEKIRTLIDNKKLRDEMGRNARRCAEEKFNRENSYIELLECIIK